MNVVHDRIILIHIFLNTLFCNDALKYFVRVELNWREKAEVNKEYLLQYFHSFLRVHFTLLGE